MRKSDKNCSIHNILTFTTLFSVFNFSEVENMFNTLLVKLIQSGFLFDNEVGFIEIPFTDVAFSAKV